MCEEEKFVGNWIDAIKTLAPDKRILIMRGVMRLKTRPSDKEALELIERYRDKTFGEVMHILDDAQFWLKFIQMLSFEKEKEAKKE